MSNDEKKFSKGNASRLLNSLKTASAEHLPGILEEIPILGGLLSKTSKLFIDAAKCYNEGENLPNTVDESQVDAVKKEVEELIKAKTWEKPPIYMSCVSFYCRTGYNLTEDRRERLEKCFAGECELTDREQEGINILFDYMGGIIAIGCDDDYFFTDDELSFNFCMYDDFLYDEEKLEKIMAALNSVLREPVFVCFSVGGQDEPVNDEDY